MQKLKVLLCSRQMTIIAVEVDRETQRKREKEREREKISFKERLLTLHDKRVTLWPANKSDHMVECEDPNNPRT